MATLQQAPRLIHQGKKFEKKTIFYQTPQDLVDIILNNLEGKAGNQMKIMWVLLGTAGDGSFRVSEKWIQERTGMSQQAYNRARKALVERGWLRLEKGCIYLLLDEIRAQGTASSCASHCGTTSCSIGTTSSSASGTTSSSASGTTSNPSQAQHDVVYNIKENKINIKEIENLESRFGKDGSLLKEEGWIDTYIPNFYDLAREKQIEALSNTPVFDLTTTQAEYVVDKILN